MPDQARQKVNFEEREAPQGDDGLLVTYTSRHPELDYAVNQGAKRLSYSRSCVSRCKLSSSHPEIEHFLISLSV